MTQSQNVRELRRQLGRTDMWPINDAQQFLWIIDNIKLFDAN